MNTVIPNTDHGLRVATVDPEGIGVHRVAGWERDGTVDYLPVIVLSDAAVVEAGGGVPARVAIFHVDDLPDGERYPARLDEALAELRRAERATR